MVIWKKTKLGARSKKLSTGMSSDESESDEHRNATDNALVIGVCDAVEITELLKFVDADK